VRGRIDDQVVLTTYGRSSGYCVDPIEKKPLMVPLMGVAAEHARRSDIFLVVGTSMVVYPAAGLIDYVPFESPKYVIDPNIPEVAHIPYVYKIPEKASTGMEKLRKELLQYA
jgi:NAD-dependent deacetylase